MAKHIPTDPRKPVLGVSPKGRTFTLEEIYPYVDGGPVEFLRLPDTNLIMVVNGDAKLRDSPQLNERANAMVTFPTVRELKARMVKEGVTYFVGTLPEDENAPADYIAGDVLLCFNYELE